MPEPMATTMDYIFKPMLMPLLMLFLYSSAKDRWSGKMTHLLIALVFAWGGDLALMLGDGGLLFLLGLGSFLVMQVLYILLFRQDWPNPTFLRRKAYWALPFVAIGASFYFMALPALIADIVMVIAVAIYATALVSMSLTALNRKGGVEENSFRLLFIGAVLFLASDLMIGANAFIVKDFPMAGLAIMTTYIAGQWCIVKGYLMGN
jgi:uncharacterized membrane protein YhhN